MTTWAHIKETCEKLNNNKVTEGHLFKGMRTGPVKDTSEVECLSEYLSLLCDVLIIDCLKIYKQKVESY